MTDREEELDEALNRQARVEEQLLAKLRRDADLAALAESFVSTVATVAGAVGMVALRIAAQALVAEAAQRLERRNR